MEKQTEKKQVVVGTVLSGAAFEPHPVYGPRRDVKVTEVSESTGRWTSGVITCACGGTRDIHSGDWFQVTQCEDCKATERKTRRNAANAEKRQALVLKRAAQKETRAKKLTEKRLASEAKKQAAAKAREAQKAVKTTKPTLVKSTTEKSIKAVS